MALASPQRAFVAVPGRTFGAVEGPLLAVDLFSHTTIARKRASANCMARYPILFSTSVYLRQSVANDIPSL